LFDGKELRIGKRASEMGFAWAELERRTASQDLSGAGRARMRVAEPQTSSLVERPPFHRVFVSRRRPILTGGRWRLRAFFSALAMTSSFVRDGIALSI
jgi:hypothetical protein